MLDEEDMTEGNSGVVEEEDMGSQLIKQFLGVIIKCKEGNVKETWRSWRRRF